MAFVLIVMVALPFFWLMGWAVDYLTGGPQALRRR